MGCDIHMWAEIKHTGRPVQDTPWRCVGRMFTYPYRQESMPTIYWWGDEGESEWDQIYTVHPFMNRNYLLFAILAGVRNYSDVEPVAEPRGLPDDVSSYVKHESDEMGVDGHSHSWLSLSELESVEWPTDFPFDNEFVIETIPKLQSIRQMPNVEDLRIVFFFDN